MIKAVIFDLDGTLIEGAGDLHAAANALLAEYGFGPIDLRTTTTFIGNGMGMLVQRCFAIHGAEAPMESVARFKELYAAERHQRTELFPGARAALRWVAAHYPLGLCTNKDAGPTNAILDHLGIRPLFRVVIAGDTLAVNKPDPATLRAAAAGCGADVSEIIYVGDSEVDADLARAAGAVFVLFEGGYRGSTVDALAPDASFADYSRFTEVIQDLVR